MEKGTALTVPGTRKIFQSSVYSYLKTPFSSRQYGGYTEGYEL